MGASTADDRLEQRATAGDADAFAALCDRHRGRLWRVVASVAHGKEADDLAQEAIIRAFRARAQYRGDAPFAGWLCRIAANVAHDYCRSAWYRRVTDWFAAEAAPPGPCLGADEEALRNETRRRVRREVAALPEDLRTPLWLHYFEGFGISEIARLAGRPESTIRSRMQCGMKRLSSRLADWVDEAPRPGAVGNDARCTRT
ncbi:MAG TPA: RNA polymerase sigma factor [Chthonomonadales bacterium]|nr:RNA polymerase sigma factor [Chthonomonadales bacterium]